MITYKDKTWCTFSKCKNSKECKRFLTDKDKEEADKWWGKLDGTPIMVYLDKPDCYEENN